MKQTPQNNSAQKAPLVRSNLPTMLNYFANFTDRLVEKGNRFRGDLLRDVLDDGPGARLDYYNHRGLNLNYLPGFVSSFIDQFFKSSFDSRLAEKALRRGMGLNGKRNSEFRPWLVLRSAESLSTVMHGWRFVSSEEAIALAKRVAMRPFNHELKQAIERAWSGPNHETHFRMNYFAIVDDENVGPLLRRVAPAIIDVMRRATILKDAERLLGLTLPPSDFLRLMQSGNDSWGIFETRHWKSIEAVTDHLRAESPDIDKVELSFLVSRFANSKRPIEDVEQYRQVIREQVRAKRSATLTEPIANQPSDPVVEREAPRFQELIETALKRVNKNNLTPSEIKKYGKSLTALCRKSGITSPAFVLELLSQSAHPETICREMREQLRPRWKSENRNVPEQESVDFAANLKLPARTIRLYEEESGRNDVRTWLERQPPEIRAAIESKFDLIQQGANGKGLSRGSTDKLNGIAEWRIKRANATLRIYFLPAHRESGEVTVLLIGTKPDQFEDVNEATRRAGIVRARRAAGNQPI